MIRPARLLPLLCAALTLPLSQAFFQGCATITQGPLQKVKFDSKPTGATVYLDGKNIGATPRLVVLSRFRRPRMRIELAGYEPYDLQLTNNAQWMAVEGNMLLGCVPIVIDVMTGSLYEIGGPSGAHPGLVTQPWSNDNADYGRGGALFIGVVLKPQSGARKIGQMQRR